VISLIVCECVRLQKRCKKVTVSDESPRQRPKKKFMTSSCFQWFIIKDEATNTSGLRLKVTKMKGRRIACANPYLFVFSYHINFLLISLHVFP